MTEHWPHVYYSKFVSFVLKGNLRPSLKKMIKSVPKFNNLNLLSLPQKKMSCHIDLSHRGLTELDLNDLKELSQDLGLVTHLYLNNNCLEKLPDDFFLVFIVVVTRPPVASSPSALTRWAASETSRLLAQELGVTADFAVEMSLM